MSKSFFEIKKGNFVASEKNKVNNVNLKIEKQGDIVSLLGPSGVGNLLLSVFQPFLVGRVPDFLDNIIGAEFGLKRCRLVSQLSWASHVEHDVDDAHDEACDGRAQRSSSVAQ